MGLPKISLTVLVTIFAAGAVLNVAGSGTFGTTAQKAANYITKGFGAGA